jgi:hypothetical protein
MVRPSLRRILPILLLAGVSLYAVACSVSIGHRNYSITTASTS